MDFECVSCALSREVIDRHFDQRNLEEPIIEALRRAYAAGQENMREKAGEECRSYERAAIRVGAAHYEACANDLAEIIRALPIQEPKVKEDAK
jgi:hypothetical protein